MNSKLTLVLRLLLGLLLVVFGANKFIEFLPPFDYSANEAAGQFFGTLANNYVIKTVGLVEVIVGLLLLLGRAVPFALVLMAPISVNIILYHATLDPANIGPGAFVFIVNAVLMFAHKDAYKALFR